jgi:hypothetical protein
MLDYIKNEVVYMPKLTKEIQEALVKAVEVSGSQAAFCRKTSISTASLSRYLKGSDNKINDTTWIAIEKYIEPYLFKNQISKKAHDKKISTHKEIEDDEKVLDLDNYDDVVEGIVLLGMKRPRAHELNSLISEKVSELDTRSKCFILEYINEILKNQEKREEKSSTKQKQ